MAQAVERILGKDEVTSSILVSSSKETLIHDSDQGFLFLPRFNKLPKNHHQKGGADKG